MSVDGSLVDHYGPQRHDRQCKQQLTELCHNDKNNDKFHHSVEYKHMHILHTYATIRALGTLKAPILNL